MKFTLGEACENTFILFDCQNEGPLQEPFLQKVLYWLKKLNRDDALILVDAEANHNSLLLEMKVLGHDGQFAEFCGNGARFTASYLYKHYPQYGSFYLRSQRFLHRLSKKSTNIYSVKIPSAHFECNPRFVVKPEYIRNKFNYVELGEPHLIVQGCWTDEQLFKVGRELNQQREIFPDGINVNCWHLISFDKIFVKTYERGVQRLTRSCGTGSVACAAFYKGHGSVKVATPGGALEVVFEQNEVELSGLCKITESFDSFQSGSNLWGKSA